MLHVRWCGGAKGVTLVVLSHAVVALTIVQCLSLDALATAKPPARLGTAEVPGIQVSEQPLRRGASLGVELRREPLTPGEAADLGLRKPAGAVVVALQRNGPAAVAGVKLEDVIVKLGGANVETAGDLAGVVSSLVPGTRLPISLIRGGKQVSLTVLLGPPREGRAVEVIPRFVVPQPRDQKEPGPWFGFEVEAAPDGTSHRGALIASVYSDGPADRAGITRGAVVLKVNGQSVSGPAQASAFLRAVAPGHVARLVVWMAGADGGSERLVFLPRPAE